MSSSQHSTSSRPEQGSDGSGHSNNPFVAIGLFIKQVLAELGKVVVPTRTEMLGYTITVLLFVFVMILIVFGLDLAFGWVARQVFTSS